MSESIGIIRRRSSQTFSTRPLIVASSKYQMLMGDLPLLAILLTAKANRTSPSGSPRWTPVSERIVSLPITTWLLMVYDVDAKKWMGLLMNKLQGNDLVSRYRTHFFMSNLTSTLFSGTTRDWTKARTACAAASHPTLTPARVEPDVAASVVLV